MSCRVGTPNIYLSEENRECLTSPAYSTCVGLVLSGLEGAAQEEPTLEEQVVQSSVEHLEQDTVELPLDDVLSEMHMRVTVEKHQQPQPDPSPEETPRQETPAASPAQEPLREAEPVRVEKVEEPDEEEEEAPSPQKPEKAEDPEAKPKGKNSRDWNRKIEATIVKFLKKIE